MKKLIAALFIVLIAAPAFALTRSEIRTEIRLRVKDSHATNRRYSDSQLNNMINEAQRDVNNATWVCMKSTDIALAIGTTYYSFPSDVIAITRATREKKLLQEVSLAKLDADFRGGAWENTSGTPTSYFQDMTRPEDVGFYPWPATSASTGTVVIQYVSQPEDLDDDADIPFLAKDRFLPYHDLIVFYVCYRVFLIEGDGNRATAYRQEYENRLMVMRDRVGSRPNFNPSFTGGASR